MQSTSCKMLGWMNHKLESRNQDCQEKYQHLKYADDTTLMAESEEELKSLLKVKRGDQKAGLKLNIQKINIMVSSPITPWQVEGEKFETDEFYFIRIQNHCRQ